MDEPLTLGALASPRRRLPIRYGLIAAGLAVSLALSWLALRRVDPHAFVRSFRSTDYRYLFPAAGALAAAVGLRCIRWRLLFAPGRRPPLRAVGRAFLIGYFFNCILPARPGELARAVALHRETRTPTGEALATTVVERVYDVLALLAFFSIAALFATNLGWLGPVPLLALVCMMGVALLVFAATRGKRRPARWLEWSLSALPRTWLDRARLVGANFVQGLASLRDWRLSACAIALTVASWLILAFSAWMLLLGFHLDAGFGAALLVVAAANLALAVPGSPGGIGVFEAATVGVLSAFAVERSDALSYALALHGLNLFPYLIAGTLALQSHLYSIREPRS